MSPTHAAQPCSHPGCRNLTTGGYLCAAHKQQGAHAAEAERGSASSRGYDTTWRKLRKMVLARSPLCADPYGVHANQVVAATDVDHIIALAKGGTNALTNLQTLCHACHSRKTARVDR